MGPAFDTQGILEGTDEMSTNEEPPCKSSHKHDWFKLGIEDNGDNVHRCGTCMTRKYVKQNGKIVYDIPNDE